MSMSSLRILLVMTTAPSFHCYAGAQGCAKRLSLVFLRFWTTVFHATGGLGRRNLLSGIAPDE